MEQLKNCKDKFIYLDGYKFTRDERTGYHRCNALRKRLHQYVWEKHNGKIKEGHHIHHKDGDKTNNHISNLEEMFGNDHLKLHGENLTDEERERRRNNLGAKARPEANKWHRSEEGREWHKEHCEKVKDKLHEKKTFCCEQCQKTFEKTNTGSNRFCSNACKSRWRRLSGIDDVQRTCEVCGENFKVNKHKKKKTCTRSCASKLKYRKDEAS